MHQLQAASTERPSGVAMKTQRLKFRRMDICFNRCDTLCADLLGSFVLHEQQRHEERTRRKLN
jgi:hypothetical protein